MGVPKFFSWLSHTLPYSRAVHSADRRQDYKFPNVLALDLNAIIHPVVQKVMGANREQLFSIVDGKNVVNQDAVNQRLQAVFTGVTKRITDIVYHIRPTDTLLVAVDGVAPAAKTNQQRKRRYLADIDSRKSLEEDPTKVSVFNTNAISPGTDFMFELDERLQAFFESIRKEENPHSRVFPQNITYTSHLVPGEGEHTIADFLRKIGHPKISVFGADADLVMIYLTHVERFDDIYVLREKREEDSHHRSDNRSDKQEIVDKYISLSQLSDSLHERIKSKQPIYDFITLLMLNGNDFLPRFPSLELPPKSLSVLMDSYTRFLVDQKSPGICTAVDIDWIEFAKFLSYYSVKDEPQLLTDWGLNKDPELKIIKESVMQSRYRVRQITTSTGVSTYRFDIPGFKEGWYDLAISTYPPGDPKSYAASSKDKSYLMNFYLQGVNWVWNYYVRGQDLVNPHWYYPYHYSPLPEDVAAYIGEHNPFEWRFPTTINIRSGLSPLHQLLMILPRTSIDIVPTPIKSLYNDGSIIFDTLPLSFRIDDTGKLGSLGEMKKGKRVYNNYQKIAILPFADPQRMKIAVDWLKLPSAVLDKYKPAPVRVYTKNSSYLRPREVSEKKKKFFQKRAVDDTSYSTRRTETREGTQRRSGSSGAPLVRSVPAPPVRSLMLPSGRGVFKNSLEEFAPSRVPSTTAGRVSPRAQTRSVRPSPQQQSRQPVTSREQLRQPVTSREQSRQPVTSREQLRQPVTSREQSRQPVTSREQSRQPVTSREQSRQPVTSREQLRQPVTSREQLRQPVTSGPSPREQRGVREQSRPSPREQRGTREQSRQTVSRLSPKDELSSQMSRLSVTQRPKTGKNAYVWLLMKGDSYIPGIIVSGRSVKLTKPRNDLICMTTPDVSDNAKTALRETKIFKAIVDVPYLTSETVPMRTEDQRGKYSKWINDSFTKWNCLNLVQYDKVLFLDADTVVLKNIDNLFEMKAPAGTFSSPWSATYTNGKGFPDPYLGVRHGEIVSKDRIRKGLEGSNVCVGTTVLLDTSKEMYSEVIRIVNSGKAFGYPGCYSGADEQMISSLYLGTSQEWRMISQVYNMIPWKTMWIEGKQPKVFHYFNTKPWVGQRNGKFLDIEAWWEIVETLRDDPIEAWLPPVYPLPDERNCGWCKSIGLDYKFHTVFDENGHLSCSTIDEIDRVAIVARDFTSGLGKDSKILKSIFPPKTVVDEIQKRDILDYARRKYRMKFCLENIQPEVLKMSGKNYYFPNIEFTRDWDIKDAHKMEAILCKTRQAEEFYKKMEFTNTLYTGFTSLVTPGDQQDPNLAIHVAGASYLKGTEYLLRAWIKGGGFLEDNKDLRLIIIKQRHRINPPQDKAFFDLWDSLSREKYSSLEGLTIVGEKYMNVYLITDKLTDTYFNVITKTATFNLAPSILEGFGHTVNEGRGRKQVTVTTNNPPMNELITDPSRLINGKTESHLEELKTVPHLAKKTPYIPAIHMDEDDFISKFKTLLHRTDLDSLKKDDYKRFFEEDTLFREKMESLSL